MFNNATGWSTKWSAKRLPAALAVLLWVTLAAGCATLGLPRTATPAPQDLVNTAAAKTVSALGTLLAEGGSPSLGGATATITPTVTATPLATNTPQPPTAAPGTAAPTSGEPCNQASFISDLTIPDNSVITPNTVFTKIWEIKNTGSCAWDSSYSVVFAGRGSAMGGPASSPVVKEGAVVPGQTAKISVTMRAPDQPGDYEGFWLLRSPDNKSFGTGPKSGSPFFVKIVVAEGYSFTEHWCSAAWSSAGGEIPCPNEDDAAEGSASNGSVERVENPTLEDGKEHEGWGLLVEPQAAENGVIRGRFPPVFVPEGADFRSTIGCHPDATGCYLRFRVLYRADGGDETLLGEWNEGYEGSVSSAIKDLDALAGKAVEFILEVAVNGPPDSARGIWFDPRITK
jgi:hypothetical protein